MSIIRWDPFQNVNTLQDRINRMFNEVFPRATDDEALAPCAWKPMVDIFETESAIVISVDLPGVPKENVSVEVQNNVLTLKGIRTAEEQIPNESYYRRERCFGSFQRSFTLRESVLPDKVKARFKDGVLTIEIPFPEAEIPRQVSVKIE